MASMGPFADRHKGISLEASVPLVCTAMRWLVEYLDDAVGCMRSHENAFKYQRGAALRCCKALCSLQFTHLHKHTVMYT